MKIRDIEIDCDGCRTTIDRTDECYCEDCMEKKDDKIAELESVIEGKDAEIERLTEELNAIMVD